MMSVAHVAFAEDAAVEAIAEPSPDSEVVSAESPAPVAPRKTGSPYTLRPEFDLPIYGVSIAGTMTGFIGYDPPSCLPNCIPPKSLNALDELVVGNYNRGAHGVANVAVLSLAIAPMLFNLADSRGDGWFEDAVVFYETLLVTQMITQITKSAVDRNAPFVYNKSALDSDLESADAGRSFISGHSSTSFAAATAYTVTFWQRHPDSPWRFVVMGVAESLALGVGLLKIESGYHYPTDIIAGALTGISMGVLVPMLHSSW
jgi:membrane-associated phospholipid phosphatase